MTTWKSDICSGAYGINQTALFSDMPKNDATKKQGHEFHLYGIIQIFKCNK